MRFSLTGGQRADVSQAIPLLTGIETGAVIAEEGFLQELRHALHETAAHLADELGIVPQDVPVLEHQADLLLTTFAGYVSAVGGRLQLVAELPGRTPITLTDVGAILNQPELPPSDTPSTHAG